MRLKSAEKMTSEEVSLAVGLIIAGATLYGSAPMIGAMMMTAGVTTALVSLFN